MRLIDPFNPAPQIAQLPSADGCDTVMIGYETAAGEAVVAEIPAAMATDSFPTIGAMWQSGELPVPAINWGAAGFPMVVVHWAPIGPDGPVAELGGEVWACVPMWSDN
jgi:hypothetical protein